MYMLFYLEFELEGGWSETVGVPAPSLSDLLIRIESSTLCSIYLCTGSEKFYYPVVGSTIIDSSVAAGRRTRKLYATYYATTREILEVYSESMQSSNQVSLIPRVRVEASLYIRHQECSTSNQVEDSNLVRN